MLEVTGLQDEDLLTELDRLEQRVQEISALVHQLREQNGALERECERLRQERSATVGRLSHLIERVDALRGES